MEKDFKFEYIFVLFAMFLGLILIFFIPPFQSPDEPVQFLKAYSVSEGHFFSKLSDGIAGDNLPVALKEFENRYDYLIFDTTKRISFDDINNSKNIKLDISKLQFFNQKYHAMYSSFAYFPQSIGIFIAKMFTSSIYWIMIGAKFALLLFYVFCGYLSIKTIPFCKQIVFLLLLMPMSLSLGASVSADGVLIALSILFFSYILKISVQKENINKKQLFFLAIFAIVLALIKQSVLLSLFVLFIPKEKFTDKYFAKVCSILIPAFIVSFLWSKFSYGLFVPLNNSNPVEQVQFIAAHPIVYIGVLFRTLCAYFIAVTYSFIGILGWLDVFLFPFVYWLYYIVLGLNLFFSEDNISYKANIFQKIVLPLVCLLNFVVICTIIYVSWAVPTQISHFEGLQGRYFIPIALPFFVWLFLLIGDKKKILKNNSLIYLNLSFILIVYLNLLFGIYIRYYALF